MVKSEPIFWGIHAGRTGEADNLFLKKNVIAVGWRKIKNLGKIPPDREDIQGQNR